MNGKSSSTIVGSYIYVNNNTNIYRGSIQNDGTISDCTNLSYIQVSYSVVSGVPCPQFLSSSGNTLYLTSKFYYYSNLDSNYSLNDFRGNPYIPDSFLSVNGRSVFSTKNKVFIIGNYISNNSVFCSNVDSVGKLGGLIPINIGGLPSTAISSPSIVIYSNNVYLTDGSTGNIYVSNIDSNGNIGNFNFVTTIPNNIKYSKIICLSNNLYSIGGIDNTGHVTNVIQYTTIDSLGNLGSWNSGPNLSTALIPGEIVVTGKYLYVLGGISNNNIPVSTVQYSVINYDNTLGSFNTGVSLPINMDYFGVYVTNNNVYALYNGKYYISSINSDGTIGTWVGGRINTDIINGKFIATSAYVYLIGKVTRNSVSYSNMYYTNYYGDLNDYSVYYDTSYSTLNTETFRLPLSVSINSDTIGYIIRY
jgi:hypothetical protein